MSLFQMHLAMTVCVCVHLRDLELFVSDDQ